MISGADLVRMLADPESGLVITPIIDPDRQIGIGSLDLRLGPDIIVSRRATGATSFDASDPHAFREALRMRQTEVRRGIGDPFHLQPGEFVIARSLEYVQLPSDISAQALGRSSWGRLGLTIATATLIQPGFRGTITLELANLGNTPMVLEVGLRIAQLAFTRDRSALLLEGETERQRSRDALRSVLSPSAAQARRNRKQRVRRAEQWWRRAQTRQKPSRYDGQVAPSLSQLHQDRDLLWVSPMALKYVVGVVGHRFAGKSTVVNFLTSRRGFRLYRLAQFVYEEARRRGEDSTDHDTLRRVGKEMRGRWGDDVLARMAFARIRSDYLDADRQKAPAVIVIEGFKVPAELAAWQRLDIFRTLLVETPPLDRLKRAVDAGLVAEEEKQEPLPGQDDHEGRLDWLQRWVDKRPDGRAFAQPVVDEAEACDRTIRLDNSQFGVRSFNDRLKDEVHELDLWARTLSF